MNDSRSQMKPETILFVDDEKVILETVCEILRESGYVMLSAADGLTACEVFDKHINEIDLVILDLSLPKRSGADVLDYIRSKRADMKVLVCSGYVDSGQVGELLTKGNIHFLAKPYQFEQIITAIRVCLDGE